MKSNSMFTAVVLVLGLGAVATRAEAQVTDEWRMRAVIYGYFPDIGGSTSFPTGTTGNIDVNASTVISNLKFTFMGLIEARKGRWGGLVDVMYLNVGGSKSQTRDLSVAGRPLPIGATANLNLDIKGSIVTLGGEYAAIADPGASLDLVAGARSLSVKQNLSWEFSVDLPSGTGPSRSGNTEAKATNWDGIVGVKGRLNFGADREWFVPYYMDVGTGDSKLTWQAIGGIGHAFKWGQVIAAWRYLDYRFKSGSAIENLNFNGPAIGVGFDW